MTKNNFYSQIILFTSFLSLVFLAAIFPRNSFADQDFRHGISVFGDLKYPPNFKNFAYVNPNAPKGGKIKYGVEGTFNSLNPFILKGISAAGIEMIYDSLTEGANDEIGSRYGLIAESICLDPNKNFIIFKLRKNAYWQDGKKITADDVVFSFNSLIEKGHPSYKIVYRDVKEVIKINDYEVRFNFKNNHNRDLPLAVASLTIIPKHYYEKNAFEQTNLIPPLGSGPYMVKSVDAGRSITFVRNKNYWAKDLPINKGRYNFDIITYDYYRDNNVLIEAFKAGAYDFRQENIARNWANAYNIDKVKNGQIIKKEIANRLPTGMQAFVFNLRKEKFKDRNLREAINYAFDFEWVREKIFYGAYQRTQSFFSNSEFASSGMPSLDELKLFGELKKKFGKIDNNAVPQRALTKEFKLPITDGSGYSRSNLLIAKKILEDSGYYLEDRKLIDPKTKEPIEIEFLLDSKSFQMVIAPMINNLAKLGIKAKMRLVDENQYKNRLDNFNFDIVVGVFPGILMPGNEQFIYWHSSQKNIPGGSNLTGIDNKAVDYLVTKIGQAKTKAELKVLTKTLDRILLWNFYVIPHWHNRTYRILYQNKFAMPEKSPDYGIGVDSWWQSKL